MTRLDALMEEEATARQRATGHLAVLESMCKLAARDILLNRNPPVNSLTAKAVAAQESCLIWEATRHAVQRERERRRAPDIRAG